MDLDNFHQVFPDQKKNPYTKDRVSAIMRNRSLLDGSLFIDCLLTVVADIEDPSRIYPPKSISNIRHLFEVLQERDLESLKKSSFYYYILKDFDVAFPGSDYAGNYARKIFMPDNFCCLMDGYHALDNLDFENAIRHLTDPAVTPSDPDKIMRTFLAHGGPRGPQFALAFVDSVQPILSSDSSVRLHFTALKLTSVEIAFEYQRTVPKHLRKELFTSLVDHCLTVERETNALKLINFPFDAREEDIFRSYIKNSNQPIAQEAMLVKNIHQGILNEALSIADSSQYQSEPELGGVGWAGLARGLALGMGPRRMEN